MVFRPFINIDQTWINQRIPQMKTVNFEMWASKKQRNFHRAKATILRIISELCLSTLLKRLR